MLLCVCVWCLWGANARPRYIALSLSFGPADAMHFKQRVACKLALRCLSHGANFDIHKSAREQVCPSSLWNNNRR